VLGYGGNGDARAGEKNGDGDSGKEERYINEGRS
jgi:hypothetical protein